MQETGYSLRIGNQHNTHEEQPHWKLGTGNWEPPTGKPFSKSRLRLRLRSRYRFRYSGWQPGTGNWELPNGERFLPKPIAIATVIAIPISTFRPETRNWKLGTPQRGTAERGTLWYINNFLRRHPSVAVCGKCGRQEGSAIHSKQKC